ncbi:tyrosine-protein phosphatase [Pajaroellobacter abortibovis]|uniref:protein-tyrosine-phosphatase n=1 Tax=Pajaroellobacter abortibovis TaxID=1882918 RepID=A0A1L6MWZ0_9BACT|nr:CpsB/CapC family capsule biosynthesis tyrosine phosphatase [Pajaroellobacter abortibovis]APS00070.1 hypothetical protein BCY86_04780 [Pajaroellobacter abortibovis]
MKGWIDLHCHWLPQVDDGSRSLEESIALLQGLSRLGFGTIVATPHIRPPLFDSSPSRLRLVFEEAVHALKAELNPCPTLFLASEHFFDDVVFRRLMDGKGLPYPGNQAALIEFYPDFLPASLSYRLFDLRRGGILPVIAHPERYTPVWQNLECLDVFLQAGAFLLLDVCALSGKYGRFAQRSAERLLKKGAYHAACSDAHRPSDVEQVACSLEKLESIVGARRMEELLIRGPSSILGLSFSSDDQDLHHA